MHKLLAVLMILFVSSCTSSTYTHTPAQPITGYKKTAHKKHYLAKKEMNNCWKGKVDTSTIMTPDDFFRRLEKINFQKGEYETTQDYNKRLDRELSAHALEGPLYVKKKFDPKYIEYNPDSGILNFIRYGVSNYTVKCEAINRIRDYKNYEEYDARNLCSSFGNQEINLSFSETGNGTYKASNAFGVTVNVSRIEHIVQGLLEGPEKPRGYYGNPIKLWPGKTIFQMQNVPIAQAKELKNNSSVIIGFRLKAPFYKTGEYSYTPSIDVPVDRRYIYKYAIADIQCVVLMDEKWNVLSRISLN